MSSKKKTSQIKEKTKKNCYCWKTADVVSIRGGGWHTSKLLCHYSQQPSDGDIACQELHSLTNGSRPLFSSEV